MTFQQLKTLHTNNIYNNIHNVFHKNILNSFILFFFLSKYYQKNPSFQFKNIQYNLYCFFIDMMDNTLKYFLFLSSLYTLLFMLINIWKGLVPSLI